MYRVALVERSGGKAKGKAQLYRLISVETFETEDAARTFTNDFNESSGGSAEARKEYYGVQASYLGKRADEVPVR